jgi:hypothetical protein
MPFVITHVRPQTPQFKGSVWRSAQVPSQLVSEAVHEASPVLVVAGVLVPVEPVATVSPSAQAAESNTSTAAPTALNRTAR